MRYLIVISFILISHLSAGQLLDPYQEWFEMESFFYQEELSESKIKVLRFEISNKQDDKIFYDKGEFLEYKFDKKGLLVEVSKRVAMANGFDTSNVKFFYDQKGRLIKKIDQQGPFHFEFYFIHLDDQLSYRELKIRPQTSKGDTLYDRIHEVSFEKGKEVELIKNRVGKAFLKKETSYLENGRLADRKLTYLFNNKQIKSNYFHEDQRLVGKQYQKAFGEKRNKIWKFKYERNELEMVEVFNKGLLHEKIAFTYKNGLPSAIILRNIQDKYVRIYKCNYDFW